MNYNVGLYVIIGRAILSNDETLRTDPKTDRQIYFYIYIYIYIGVILEERRG